MFQPSNPDGQSQSIGDSIKNWWASVPFINKSIITIATFLYLLCLFTSSKGSDLGIGSYLMNNSESTVFSFQLWRLFTATFTHGQMLHLIFCLISLIPDTIKLEKLLGSVVFLFDLIVKGLQVQITFALLMTLFSFISPIMKFIPSLGLWTIVMVYLTIRCATNPEESTYFLCFPVVIKQKYYPILIIVIFFILSQSMFDLIVAMLVGYTEFYFFNSMMIRLSLNRALKLENSFLFTAFKQRPDFVTCQNINSPYFSGSYGHGHQGEASNSAQAAASASSNVQAFSGRGVQIGASSLPNLPNISPPFYGNSNSTNLPSSNNASNERAQASSGSVAFSGKGISIGGGAQGSAFQSGGDDILRQPVDPSQINQTNQYVKLTNEDTEQDRNKKTKPEDLL